MKIRNGFVTNSSSSSFLITNVSDKPLTMEELVKSYFEKVIEDAKENFEHLILEPGESTILECTDHRDKSEFEAFIHSSNWNSLYSDKAIVSLVESHH